MYSRYRDGCWPIQSVSIELAVVAVTGVLLSLFSDSLRLGAWKRNGSCQQCLQGLPSWDRVSGMFSPKTYRKTIGVTYLGVNKNTYLSIVLRPNSWHRPLCGMIVGDRYKSCCCQWSG
jgi:hypothetical protein